MQRIGVIGDVHAEHQHLNDALAFLRAEGVDGILCTGDIADGRGDIDHCIDLLGEYGVQVVRGNHDRWVIQHKARHVPNAHLWSDLSQHTREFLSNLPVQLDIDTADGQLLLCHGVQDNDLQKIWPGSTRMPPERSSRLDRLIANGQYRYMINGHVHYRTLIHFEALTLINAGTLKRDHHPGFSILDLGQRRIEGYELEPAIHQVKTLPLDAQGQVFRDTQQFDGQWQPVTLYA